MFAEEVGHLSRVDDLSATEARRIALRAQLMSGAPDRRAGVVGVLRALGAVQLDTISVLARSHELVIYARLGPVGRTTVERTYWESGQAFEYWAHAACLLPIELWPLFAFRRRHYGPWANRSTLRAAKEEVRRRLLAEGPLTATELGGARKGGPWWDWSEAKLGVEALLLEGEVACVKRRGWKRVYDLAERAVPDELLAKELGDTECHRELVRLACRRLGVATRKDLADYFRLRLDQVDEGLRDSDLIPVRVQGWPDQAWLDPLVSIDGTTGRRRPTLLSPFDSLVWDRARTERVFGFTHRLEAYVPAPKRVHGYFAMPLLAGGKLIARIDPKRAGTTLTARRVSFEPAAIRNTAAGSRSCARAARALADAASWVGSTKVEIGVVDPVELRPGLVEQLRRLGL